MGGLHPFLARLWLVASFLVPGALSRAPRGAGPAGGLAAAPTPLLCPPPARVWCQRMEQKLLPVSGFPTQRVAHLGG